MDLAERLPWSHLSNTIKLETKQSPGLQAADLLVYASSRLERNDHGEPSTTIETSSHIVASGNAIPTFECVRIPITNESLKGLASDFLLPPDQSVNMQSRQWSFPSRTMSDLTNVAPIPISKLDAARRQLVTASRLFRKRRSSVYDDRGSMRKANRWTGRVTHERGRSAPDWHLVSGASGIRRQIEEVNAWTKRCVDFS